MKTHTTHYDCGCHQAEIDRLRGLLRSLVSMTEGGIHPAQFFLDDCKAAFSPAPCHAPMTDPCFEGEDDPDEDDEESDSPAPESQVGGAGSRKGTNTPIESAVGSGGVTPKSGGGQLPMPVQPAGTTSTSRATRSKR